MRQDAVEAEIRMRMIEMLGIVGLGVELGMTGRPASTGYAPEGLIS
jgi:hypothetical protein